MFIVSYLTLLSCDAASVVNNTHTNKTINQTLKENNKELEKELNKIKLQNKNLQNQLQALSNYLNEIENANIIAEELEEELEEKNDMLRQALIDNAIKMINLMGIKIEKRDHGAVSKEAIDELIELYESMVENSTLGELLVFEWDNELLTQNKYIYIWEDELLKWSSGESIRARLSSISQIKEFTPFYINEKSQSNELERSLKNKYYNKMKEILGKEKAFNVYNSIFTTRSLFFSQLREQKKQ